MSDSALPNKIIICLGYRVIKPNSGKGGVGPYSCKITCGLRLFLRLLISGTTSESPSTMGGSGVPPCCKEKNFLRLTWEDE